MTHLDNWQTLVSVIAMALGIMATRFLPFILFSEKTKLPPAILYLGGALPHASMTMLLVYCLKDVSLTEYPSGMPELLAMLFTGALYWWLRNVLLGIAGGTLCYMFLVQQVFV